MRRVPTEQFAALYNRTYKVLYDAGVDEKLAGELATQRALVVVAASREQSSTRFVTATTEVAALTSW